ncbi:MAG: N-acetyltransferase [Ilumatobacter sp.]|uniref:GNAT family N-acetyltransferase n=1 Tax=Ilumatobacter sp. TaxID=1967498 RepID=UPI002615AFC3|nr:N-acetyltransferase [Ilumatobacter sp.]MDJ0770380.1 N-acetyltransferase [Ilumatobacter sp.]
MSELPSIRPVRPSDHPDVRRVVERAFGSVVEADLAERIRASSEYIPELELVAVCDHDVSGHVMVSSALLRRDDGDVPIVMLSPLAVDPAHQRRGIGSALVRVVADRTARRDEPLIVVEGDHRYYARFGFEHAAPYGITLPLPDWAPSEAGQVLWLGDAPAPGVPHALRGTVVYPPAFDGL